MRHVQRAVLWLIIACLVLQFIWQIIMIYASQMIAYDSHIRLILDDRRDLLHDFSQQVGWLVFWSVIPSLIIGPICAVVIFIRLATPDMRQQCGTIVSGSGQQSGSH
jgi:hypothetical protein